MHTHTNKKRYNRLNIEFKQKTTKEKALIRQKVICTLIC